MGFDQSLGSNPLQGLLESSTLSRTGQRDLYDLTTVAVGQGMSIQEDLEFQFETLANTLVYEHNFMKIKSERNHRKMRQEVDPQLAEKTRLRDMLESLYEGQQIKQDQKTLQQYSSKMKKDTIEREIKTQQMPAVHSDA